jgi:hypothetical protein
MTPEDEHVVRTIVREEIVRAFQALKREADSLDMPYETAELDSRALGNIVQSAEGAVKRLTCTHEEYWDWGGRSNCARCGEPEPEPVNPFEPCDHAWEQDEHYKPTECMLCGIPYKEEN